jgi:hypothetical protein
MQEEHSLSDAESHHLYLRGSNLRVRQIAHMNSCRAREEATWNQVNINKTEQG